jgi:ABC-type lipoprotein release transport system permease subunit
MFKLAGKIAWVSLSRRGTRSILVVLMIAISLWGLLFMEGIYDGMIEQMVSNAIRSDSGHLSLFAEGYRLDPDLSRQVTDVKDIDNFLAKDKRVLSYVKRLKQEGLVATAHYSRGTIIYGIDLEEEKQHGGLDNYLFQGEFDFGPLQRGAIIGFKLADKLQVRIGSKIIVSAQDSHMDVSSVSLKVKGILKTNNMAMDENAVFVAVKKGRQLLAVEKGVSQVAVLLHDEGDLSSLQQDLQIKFPHLEVLRWDELYPALLQSRVMMKNFNLIISLLIFCVAALGIFGVMLVSVLERLREFGIMMAIGTRFLQIGNIILLESFFLGFIGFTLGSLVGGGTLYYFRIYGLDLSMFSDAFNEFGMDAVTYAIIRPSYFLTAMTAVVMATFFSVLIPLWLLKKAKPIEAISKI